MRKKLAICMILIWAISLSVAQAGTRQPLVVQTPNGKVLIDCFTHCTNVTHPTVLILSGSKGFGSAAYDEIGQIFGDSGLDAYLVHFLSLADLDAIAKAGSSSARVRYYKTRQAAWIAEVQSVVSYFNTRHHEIGKVGVLGISLGAEVAAAASANRTDIGALVIVDGSFSDDYSQTIHSLPPLHLIWGSADQTFPLSAGLSLQRLAGQLGGTPSLSVYKGCSHDFFLRPEMPQARNAHLNAASFLVSQLSASGK